MKRFVVGALVLVIAQNGLSQIDFGINVKAGVGEMKKTKDNSSAVYQNTFASKPSVSWGGSFIVAKRLHSLLTIYSEIGYNFMRGMESESFSVIQTDNGFVNKHHTSTVRDAHYISLPIGIDFTIAEKVTIGGGVSANYMLTNNRNSEYFVNDVSVGFDRGGNDLNRFDFGLHAQLSVRLSAQFVLLGRANFGLMNIRPSDIRDSYSSFVGLPQHQSFQTRNRQYTLGVTYLINTKKDS